MDRAEGYHDKILCMAERLDEAGSLVTKEEIAAKKVSIDAYKWAAEKGNPDLYGKKQEIRHEGAAPQTMLVINTGIVRKPKEIKPDVIVEQKGQEKL